MQQGFVTTNIVRFTFEDPANIVAPPPPPSKDTIRGVIDGQYYNYPVTITYTEGMVKLNNSSIRSGEIVLIDGSYTLVLTDNNSGLQWQLTNL